QVAPQELLWAGLLVGQEEPVGGQVQDARRAAALEPSLQSAVGQQRLDPQAAADALSLQARSGQPREVVATAVQVAGNPARTPRGARGRGGDCGQATEVEVRVSGDHRLGGLAARARPEAERVAADADVADAVVVEEGPARPCWQYLERKQV